MTDKLLLRGNRVFALCMWLLCVVGNSIIAWASSRLVGLLELSLDVYLLALCITLLPGRLQRIVRPIVSSFMYLVTALDVGLIATTGVPITPTFLMVCLQTNQAEATEAITTYCSWRSFVVPGLWLIPIALLHFYLTRYYRPQIGMKPKARGFMALLIAACAVCALSTLWVEKKYKYHRLVMQRSELEAYFVEDLEPRTKFFLPAYRLWDACVQVSRMRGIYDRLRASQDVQDSVQCSFTSPEIVLIIGESFSRHHSALYGYRHMTTPHQCQWQERGNLIAYSDVVSRWNMTCESLQSLLSLSFAGDSLDWYERPFITSLMRKAGYEVSLISNQYSLHSSQCFSDFIEDVFINIEEVSRAQFDHRNSRTAQLDDVLLEAYDSIASLTKATNRFTILHTKGMHFDFKERYPDGFGSFTPDDYDAQCFTEEERANIAHYDNAILYNDSIIHQVLKRLEHRNAIVLFVPDHGERVYDYDKGFGRSYGFGRNEMLPQHEIPMWMWASDQYQASHTELWRNIEAKRHLPYMTDALAHTIITLAGIQTDLYRPEADFLSESYDSLRPRILRNHTDYDKQLRPHKPAPHPKKIKRIIRNFD